MSTRFKVGDLVVRNPDARGVAGWPYGDEVCRVVGHYLYHSHITVLPVNSPPNARHHDISWMAERFTPVALFDPCPARRNHPGNMTPMAEEAWNRAIVMLGDALAEQPAEQEPVAWCDQYEGHIDGLRHYSDGGAREIPLYTAPQPAKRVGSWRMMRLESYGAIQLELKW